MRAETVGYHFKTQRKEEGRKGEREVVALACNSQHLRLQAPDQTGLKK